MVVLVLVLVEVEVLVVVVGGGVVAESKTCSEKGGYSRLIELLVKD
jgi:hypothetical protein